MATTTTTTTRKTKTTDPTEAAKKARAAKATPASVQAIDLAKATKTVLLAELTKLGIDAPAKATNDTLRDMIADASAPTTEPTKADIAKAAKVEKKALDAWVADGRKGDKPATENLDRLAVISTPTKKAAAKKATTSTRVVQTVDFFHDGKAMPASQNKLSSVAFQFTKKVDGDEPRISSAALVAMLAKAGITDPMTTAWSYTLPNGIVLSAVIRKS